MYEKIKHFMTEKNLSTGSCMKNESPEYVGKLFDDRRDETYLHNFLQGPIIVKSEVENALNSMSKGNPVV